MYAQSHGNPLINPDDERDKDDISHGENDIRNQQRKEDLPHDGARPLIPAQGWGSSRQDVGGPRHQPQGRTHGDIEDAGLHGYPFALQTR